MDKTIKRYLKQSVIGHQNNHVTWSCIVEFDDGTFGQVLEAENRKYFRNGAVGSLIDHTELVRTLTAEEAEMEALK